MPALSNEIQVAITISRRFAETHAAAKNIEQQIRKLRSQGTPHYITDKISQKLEDALQLFYEIESETTEFKAMMFVQKELEEMQSPKY